MKSITLLIVMMIHAAACAQTFTLKSKELGGQATKGQVLTGFGCSGESKSPLLYWENAPIGAKSFAVTLFDQDSPTISGWWHWLIFDIDRQTSELKSDAGNSNNALAPPKAIQGKTDFETAGYGGPYPPSGSGAHRYVITLYALNTEKPGLDADASLALVGFYLNQHTIEKVSMIFTTKDNCYGKSLPAKCYQAI